MTKPLPIAAIKEKLVHSEELTAEFITSLRADNRQGVQKLLQQYDKRQAKVVALQQKYQEMSQFEKQARLKGAQVICGIDEVGRGPLAGPVVAAAVVLPTDCVLLGLNDSKQLSEKQRDTLFLAIQEQALAIGIGSIAPEIIDEVNIYEASKLAMIQAVENLALTPDYLLIDAMVLDMPIAQEKLIKGDARSISIAAASIVAKVTRDRWMQEYDQIYPGYDFAHNAGYGTAKHLAGLAELGITPIHRHSFAPVKKYLR